MSLCVLRQVSFCVCQMSACSEASVFCVFCGKCLCLLQVSLCFLCHLCVFCGKCFLQQKVSSGLAINYICVFFGKCCGPLVSTSVDSSKEELAKDEVISIPVPYTSL